MHTNILKVGHDPGICLFASIIVIGGSQTVYREPNVLNQITPQWISNVLSVQEKVWFIMY